MTATADDTATPKSAIEALVLKAYYAFGYRGNAMYAVDAPFRMSPKGEALVGRIVQIGGEVFVVKAVFRRAIGDIAAGEPIGIAVAPLGAEGAAVQHVFG